MQKRKVLVITHGHFGAELIRSVEMIMGKHSCFQSLGLNPGDSVDSLREQAYAILEKNEAEGYESIILCDLLGGSPSNIALACLRKGSYPIVMGVSMPLLIELIQNIEDDVATKNLLEQAIEIGKAGTSLIMLPKGAPDLS